MTDDGKNKQKKNDRRSGRTLGGHVTLRAVPLEQRSPFSCTNRALLVFKKSTYLNIELQTRQILHLSFKSDRYLQLSTEQG